MTKGYSPNPISVSIVRHTGINDVSSFVFRNLIGRITDAPSSYTTRDFVIGIC